MHVVSTSGTCKMWLLVCVGMDFTCLVVVFEFKHLPLVYATPDLHPFEDFNNILIPKVYGIFVQFSRELTSLCLEIPCAPSIPVSIHPGGPYSFFELLVVGYGVMPKSMGCGATFVVWLLVISPPKLKEPYFPRKTNRSPLKKWYFIWRQTWQAFPFNNDPFFSAVPRSEIHWFSGCATF